MAAMMCGLGARAQEAYACYTSDNTTLMFCYDDMRSARLGTTYDLNQIASNPGWYSDGTYENVTRVVFSSSFAAARPISTSSWFAGMENLETITGLNYLNTSEVIDMDGMFINTIKVTSLNLSSFNTSKVRNLTGMFAGCTGLTSLDLSGWNTSEVVSTLYMFEECSSLKSLDLSGWNTSKVNNMGFMFASCGELQTIYVGDEWNTASVTKSELMFADCFNLVGGQGTAYDINHIDVAYGHLDGGLSNPGYLTAVGTEAYAIYTPTNTTLTFYYDTQKLDRPGWGYSLNTGANDTRWDLDGFNSNVTKVVFDPSFAGARPTTTYDWFYMMENLESIEGMEYLNTSAVTNMAYMFTDCKKLTSIDLSHFNTAQVTDMHNMFAWCDLTYLDLSSFNTAQVTNMSSMFSSCSNLQTIYAGDGWSTSAVTSSSIMFDDCFNLVGGKGTAWNSSNPTNKTYAHIDGGPSNPGYFTDKNTTEAYAVYTSSNTTLTFYYDDQRSSRSGTTYDLNTGETDAAWDTDGTRSYVTRVVFDPLFAAARPTSTYDWFYGMQKLQTIEGIEYLNTSEVTSMGYMFLNCSQLTSLDLSHFNTAKVENVRSMFSRCTGLTSLDLSSFNTSRVTNMYFMFYNCSNLQTIYVSRGWSTDAVTFSTQMFTGCTSLVGGQGTAYDANHADASYAHIDGGPSNPGYLTNGVNEAYTCFTPENTTLTFYYDTERGNRTGTTYDLNVGNYNTDWETDGTSAIVTRVVFDASFAAARPTTTYSWFWQMTNLESITGLNYLNTSEVTDMSCMFGWCAALRSIDLSHFNTSKVNTMQNMFNGCSNLTSLDLSNWNTSGVTSLTGMFRRCSSLRTIYVDSDWSTAAVTYSQNMFGDCTSLVGGQGTTYDGNHIDVAYAHIDGGPSNPGYFTDKNAALRGDVNGDHEVTISDAIMLISAIVNDDFSGVDMVNADVNFGGTVDISDAIMLINAILNDDMSGVNMENADVNGDHEVTISDAIMLINYVLNETWP